MASLAAAPDERLLYLRSIREANLIKRGCFLSLGNLGMENNNFCNKYMVSNHSFNLGLKSKVISNLFLTGTKKAPDFSTVCFFL